MHDLRSLRPSGISGESTPNCTSTRCRI